MKRLCLGMGIGKVRTHEKTDLGASVRHRAQVRNKCFGITARDRFDND